MRHYTNDKWSFGRSIVLCGLLTAASAGQAAEPGFLGPVNPGAENGWEHWGWGNNGSAIAFVGYEPASGSNDFTLGNTVMGRQNTADWRSETFPLPSATDGLLTFSFSYKLPEVVRTGDNIYVRLRFWGTDKNACLDQIIVLVGSNSGDSSMTDYKRVMKRGISVPVGARMADVWVTANIDHPWTSGMAMFDDFSVVVKQEGTSKRFIAFSLLALSFITLASILFRASRLKEVCYKKDVRTGEVVDYPKVTTLESVSVILPVVNETVSLRQTVEIILRDASGDVGEFLIVVCKKTTPEAMVVISQLRKDLGELVVVHEQTLPFLGGAMREAFDLVSGSHAIMMASDLETDPNTVRELIAKAKKDPSWIVTASRWRGGAKFEGYSRIKLLCNWVFQRFFSLLYATDLSDMTFAYRIFPTKLVQAIQWEELRHPFLFETLVKPLRLGVPVTEICSGWRARTEGESQNTFFRNFAYFRTGIKTRFASRRSILKASSPAGNSAARS